MEDLLAAAFAEGGGERVAIDPFLEPSPESASRGGIDHIPGLGLALVGRGEAGGAVVVGVDLDREIAASVEKLEQERKRRQPRMPAEEGPPIVGHQIAEGATGQRPGGDDTLVVSPVDHFPRLGEIVTRGEFPTEERGEAAAPPQVAAIDGVEEQRGQHGGIDSSIQAGNGDAKARSGRGIGLEEASNPKAADARQEHDEHLPEGDGVLEFEDDRQGRE
jgi:hypothetical protein